MHLKQTLICFLTNRQGARTQTAGRPRVAATSAARTEGERSLLEASLQLLCNYSVRVCCDADGGGECSLRAGTRRTAVGYARTTATRVGRIRPRVEHDGTRRSRHSRRKRAHVHVRRRRHDEFARLHAESDAEQLHQLLPADAAATTADVTVVAQLTRRCWRKSRVVGSC